MLYRAEEVENSGLILGLSGIAKMGGWDMVEACFGSEFGRRVCC
jgi:hypothetical protein